MTIWNEQAWFEPSGTRYVFRTSAFSRGYDVSASEKERLFEGLKRLNRRMLCEGLIAIAAAALLAMTGWIGGVPPLTWFVLLSLLSAGVIAALGLKRQDRLISTVLGDRARDAPALSFRKAISTPRPLVAPRHAASILRIVVVMTWICLGILNTSLGFLIYSAYDKAQQAAQAGDAARETMLAARYANPELWTILVGVNAIVVFIVWLLRREARRMANM